MTPPTEAQEPMEIISELQSIVGSDHVLIDDKNRELFGMDIFFKKLPPLAVVQPGNKNELARAVKAVTSAGLAVVPRGGGLSYSAGYLADRDDAVVFDTRRLNRIIEINTEDLYVHMETSVTWKQLNETLEGTGLRTPYWGTGSGMYATVGGTMSQNSINYGSATYGMLAEHVLALEVVLADGQILRTSSWAATDNPSPFARYYGPDLTGLFLGDTGALGVKAEAVMQLIPAPNATLTGAADFDSVQPFVLALSELGRSGVCSECFGFDPYFMSQKLDSVGYKEDFMALSKVIKKAGFKEAFKVAAAGRRYLEGTGHSLHFGVDGRDNADAKAKLKIAQDICTKHGGKELPGNAITVMRSTPFPPPFMMFGPNGDRWVPISGIFPHSRLRDAISACNTYMDSQLELVEKFGIEWGYVCVCIGNSMVLIEPSFYWLDEQTPFHAHYLEKSHLKRLKSYEASPEARNAVDKFRTELSEEFRKLGVVHLQIGRTYSWLESREAVTRDILHKIKTDLDPRGLMNPGSLGFG